MILQDTRSEFENHPKFRGMDFRRSSRHPDYYESAYANGAWEGYCAGKASHVERPHCELGDMCNCGGDVKAIRESCSRWVR